MKKRTSGILLHISSLSGKFGIGTLGQSAYDFVDFLQETNQTFWQILPLTSTSYGDSPYQSFSAIAGNINFIDFDLLAEEGLLERDRYEGICFGDNPEAVDYALLFEARRPILEQAVSNFLDRDELQSDLWIFEEKQKAWLQNFAEFMALKEYFDYKALQEWGDSLIIHREESRLAYYRKLLAKEITYHKVTQYFFFKQWLALKKYANQSDIKIIGDMPIYVSADSVEVWTMPELFKLNADKKPIYVAGCPPDDFSDAGQFWGNPIYNWEKQATNNFSWWIYRIQENFKLYDVLRIDHFKGFSDFWEIKSESTTAKEGRWVSGPGFALFKAIRDSLGDLPIIAEDLGYIDDKARKLLFETGFPGMKVLQFGYYDINSESIDIAHNCSPNSVGYLGTHDNEVINGWYDKLTTEQCDFIHDYTNTMPSQPISPIMLRLLYSTSSNTVIATMQDLLDKPAKSRMNLPNTIGDNWRWRMLAEDLTQDVKEFLRHLTSLYGRTNPLLLKKIKTDR